MLPRAKQGINFLFVTLGTALTVYIAFAAFGFVSSSSVHYTNFVLAIMTMASLLVLQKLLDEKLTDDRKRFWHARLFLALIATVLVIVGGSYLRLNAIRLETIQPFFEELDFWIGLLFLCGVMILNWFHWGWLLTSLIILVIVYFFYGHLVPYQLLMHPEYDLDFVMSYMGLGLNQGMFWLVRMAADTIYFLIIYASILLGVGMLRLAIEIGKAAGNRVRGGAAFPAIIGSGIIASVMGVAVANVVLTGRLTIPMMKKHGYSSTMAGAIEAVASTSGQIMPPVLGLAAFLIADYLNLPYAEVALAAVIPGLLFIIGVSIGVVIFSQRERLPFLGERVDVGAVMRLLPAFLISFGAVLILLVGFYSPSFAGMAGIALVLVFAPFQGRYRPKLKELFAAFQDGLVIVTILSLLLIAVGPLAQTFLTTNLASRLGIVLVDILPDSVVLMLLGTMIVSLFLGMGLPTPVAYIVVALTLVPFMQQIGVPALAAHFFVFYFAVFSTLTPPVATSVIAAAKLADASFIGTALDAMKLMLTTFIIPFGFVFHPELMSFPNLTWEVVPPVVLIIVLQWTSSVFCYGYFFRDLTKFERGAFGFFTFVGASVLIDKDLANWIVFSVLVTAAVTWIYLTRDRLIQAVPSGKS
jgi:TRAP transporter 4TM/12TM fusion protein